MRISADDMKHELSKIARAETFALRRDEGFHGIVELSSFISRLLDVRWTSRTAILHKQTRDIAQPLAVVAATSLALSSGG